MGRDSGTKISGTNLAKRFYSYRFCLRNGTAFESVLSTRIFRKCLSSEITHDTPQCCNDRNRLAWIQRHYRICYLLTVWEQSKFILTFLSTFWCLLEKRGSQLPPLLLNRWIVDAPPRIDRRKERKEKKSKKKNRRRKSHDSEISPLSVPINDYHTLNRYRTRDRAARRSKAQTCTWAVCRRTWRNKIWRIYSARTAESSRRGYFATTSPVSC